MAHHLAQLNVARALAPLDSPLLADFMAALDDVNAIAEASPGFVWRLKGEGDNATDIRLDDDPLLLVNMSLWQTVEALFDFVYRSGHNAVMMRRREWFERPGEAHQVLWWIPAGQLPTLAEGMARLARLRADGPSAEAFTFKQHYPAPGQGGDPVDMRPETTCSGWS
jgi:hypothetical protein